MSNAVASPRVEATLLPPEGVNLADDREECRLCRGSGLHENRECPSCWGRGTTMLSTGRKFVSHSSLSVYQECPQRFAYRYLEGLELIRRKAALRLGGAFQKAIELEAPEAAAERLEKETVAITTSDQDKLMIEQAIVVGASTAYLNKYGSAGVEQTTEFQFCVRVRNPWSGRYSQTYDLLGYADGMIDAGESWTGIENKLVGRIDASDVRRLPLNQQLRLMRYGVWRATGKPVAGFKYRYTRKPTIKQRQNESVVEFCERVEQDYADRPDFYLAEEALVFDNSDLLRIEQDVWEWTSRVREGVKRRHHPQATGRCGDWGGCDYLPLCVGDPDAETLFRRKAKR